MGDVLCKIMGIADIFAGVLIVFAFNFHILAIIFALFMGIKGGMSLA